MLNFERLIALNIEMEGLLRVMKARESEDAQKQFYDLLAEYVTLAALPESPDTAEPEESAKPSKPAESLETLKSLKTLDTLETLKTTEPEQTREPEEAQEPEETQEAPEVVTLTDEVETINDARRDEKLRVDEMLSKREARDLRKAFTLNDKFRFRRELFCNNDPLFISTLNILSSMQTLDEAQKYIVENMGWDPENEDVKDFISIIANHY